MPDAVVVGRPVFDANDPTPSSLEPGKWQTGASWLDRMWPSMAGYTGVDYYQFVNEWEGNGDPPDTVQHFNDFYVELGEACERRGIKCTFGDWSTGCPGYPTVPAEAHYLDIFNGPNGMLNWAEQHGFPVNYHAYAPEGAGARDMTAGAPYYFMRWQTLIWGHPDLRVICCEGGNAGKGLTGGPEGMFSPYTPALMQQAVTIIAQAGYQNLLAVNWWEWVNGAVHQDWANDNWASYGEGFFKWVASHV